MVNTQDEIQYQDLFTTNVKYMFRELGKQPIRVDCAALYDQIMKSEDNLTKKTRDRLFYYSVHCLKFSGMVNDGYKKGLYIMKNFFRKSTYANERFVRK